MSKKKLAGFTAEDKEKADACIYFAAEVTRCLIHYGYHVSNLNDTLECIVSLCAVMNDIEAKMETGNA
jgi:hypothetical protein